MFKFFGIWEDENIKEIKAELKQSENYDEEVWQIALDILETDYDFTILSPIAWVSLEDIDISFNKSVLTISGDRKKPNIFDTSVKIRNSECYWWKFVRNIILPENLDFDSIKASMENNLLVIIIQKLNFSSQSIKIDRIEL